MKLPVYLKFPDSVAKCVNNRHNSLRLKKQVDDSCVYFTNDPLMTQNTHFNLSPLAPSRDPHQVQNSMLSYKQYPSTWTPLFRSVIYVSLQSANKWHLFLVTLSDIRISDLCNAIRYLCIHTSHQLLFLLSECRQHCDRSSVGRLLCYKIPSFLTALQENPHPFSYFVSHISWVRSVT